MFTNFFTIKLSYIFVCHRPSDSCAGKAASHLVGCCCFVLVSRTGIVSCWTEVVTHAVRVTVFVEGAQRSVSVIAVVVAVVVAIAVAVSVVAVSVVAVVTVVVAVVVSVVVLVVAITVVAITVVAITVVSVSVVVSVVAVVSLGVVVGLQ
jgi:hypothetical protein